MHVSVRAFVWIPVPHLSSSLRSHDNSHLHAPLPAARCRCASRRRLVPRLRRQLPLVPQGLGWLEGPWAVGLLVGDPRRFAERLLIDCAGPQRLRGEGVEGAAQHSSAWGVLSCSSTR
jgi:hypothetical protein